MVLSRGKITLIYSTTSGTSKKFAELFQEVLENNNFFSPIINLGDIDFDEFLSMEGCIVLFLATYGNGDSPSDADKFYELMVKYNQNMGTEHSNKQSQIQKQMTAKQVKQQNETTKQIGICSKLSYAIMAFGNSTFQNFCGFGMKMTNFMKNIKGDCIQQIMRCDASSRQNCAQQLYDQWAQSLLSKLIERNPLLEMKPTLISGCLQAKISMKQGYQWELQAKKYKNNRNFQEFLALQQAKVIHIQELRKFQDGRSTLWIRLAAGPWCQKLSPAFNINIFPFNEKTKQIQPSLYIQFKGQKTPYPPLPLYLLQSILDFRQIASKNLLKNMLLLQNKSQKKLYDILNEKISIKEALQQIKPSLDIYSLISLNNTRPYTLCSWNKDFVDICVSLVQNGLTSTYLTSKPQTLRFKITPSTFYVPTNRPIIFIANGTGIAPFRSLLQYFYLQNQQNLQLNKIDKQLPKIELYFGIQHRQNDFYFGQEFQYMEKIGLVTLKLAESRNKMKPKQYVQDLLDPQTVKKHVFENNGVVFICGGKEMAKAIDKILFKAVELELQIPYKAYLKITELKKNKTFVAQVFG